MKQTMTAVMVATALLSVCWPNAAAQETEKETQPADSAKTRYDDPKSGQGSAIKTHKASCRCGKLTVTYKGPDPERITLCHCNSCQLRTGTAFSIQGRFPRAKVKTEGKSTKWMFPRDAGERTKFHSCDSGGATYHFCQVCGTTVYWDIHAAPDLIGIAIGTLTDPTFPPPIISGFEKYGHPWAMKAADLPIIRLELAEEK